MPEAITTLGVGTEPQQHQPEDPPLNRIQHFRLGRIMISRRSWHLAFPSDRV